MSFNRNAALVAGTVGGLGSIPVSLSADQGVLQTVINAILSGGGAALGAGVGGGVGSNSTEVGLNALIGAGLGGGLGAMSGNLVGRDRNEYAIDTLSNVVGNRVVTGNQLAIQREALKDFANAAYQGLSETKKEAMAEEARAMQEIVGSKVAAQEAMRPREELTPEDLAFAEAIVQKVLGSGITL
jgi:hypothetical protein